MQINEYHFPEDLYYEENHYWVKAEGDLLVMGMDDFAQKMAGEIVFASLPFEGKSLKLGKKFAQVESGKWLGKVYAPVNGEIVSTNQDLESKPSLINEDCYGKGWMFKIKPEDPGEIKNLIHGIEAIEKWVQADIKKFKEDQDVK
ncbi:MAG: glycine cleavage system protein H [Desulfobacteraceae bacterium]|nr:glycine cleavage system protein H [Desulfobacteraceae bacterium]